MTPMNLSTVESGIGILPMIQLVHGQDAHATTAAVD